MKYSLLRVLVHITNTNCTVYRKTIIELPSATLFEPDGCLEIGGIEKAEHAGNDRIASQFLWYDILINQCRSG